MKKNTFILRASGSQFTCAPHSIHILIYRRTWQFVNSKSRCTVNVDCVKFEYVVLAKYHHMLIFEFDLLTKQHILILCKKLL
jgi:hypothetical protein